MTAENNKKGLKRLYLILTILGAIYIFLNLIPLHSIDVKPYFHNDRPLVIAHQGGEHLAPSSTMVAFENAVQLGVDALETDIHMSNDGYLIAIHDPTVDRTTNGTGRVIDMTLEELKQLDAGYYFKDDAGQFPFRAQGLQLLTIEEIFQSFPNERFVLEIKDTNPPEVIADISIRLNDLINQYNMHDQVLIASFDQKIIETFHETAGENIAVSGGRDEVKRFVVTNKFFLKNLYFPNVDAIQIPTSDSGFDLTTNDILTGAERIGLQVHYWTINDKETMKTLLEKGADGIITDRPDLLLEVIEELGY